jgi:hypothetical protein
MQASKHSGRTVRRKEEGSRTTEQQTLQKEEQEDEDGRLVYSAYRTSRQPCRLLLETLLRTNI